MYKIVFLFVRILQFKDLKFLLSYPLKIPLLNRAGPEKPVSVFIAGNCRKAAGESTTKHSTSNFFYGFPQLFFCLQPILSIFGPSEVCSDSGREWSLILCKRRCQNFHCWGVNMTIIELPINKGLIDFYISIVRSTFEAFLSKYD